MYWSPNKFYRLAKTSYGTEFGCKYKNSNPAFRDKTAILLTTDHGGKPGTKRHGDYYSPHVYMVSFIVWGSGIAQGEDLYALNQSTRKDPKDKRPKYALKNQPIRNTIIGNVAFQGNAMTREKLELPEGGGKVLLHSCCAPCSGEVMEAMLFSGIDFSIYFYNPNIHPRKEYDLRKAENIKFADKHNVPFIDADYDKDEWFRRAKGMEMEPERGVRCTMCFDMRFERTALYAHEHGFPIITSSLGISRWKNMNQINDCGVRAASHYPDITYWTFNWRKKGGAQRMIEISKREKFYQQEYCGCAYSMRDTNRFRRSQGRENIHIGVKFYGNDSKKE